MGLTQKLATLQVDDFLFLLILLHCFLRQPADLLHRTEDVVRPRELGEALNLAVGILGRGHAPVEVGPSGDILSVVNHPDVLVVGVLGSHLLVELAGKPLHQRVFGLEQVNDPLTHYEAVAAVLLGLLAAGVEFLLFIVGASRDDPVLDLLLDAPTDVALVDLSEVAELVAALAVNLLHLLNNVVETGAGLLEVVLGMKSSHSTSKHDVALG
eukprot:CAMPEP_0170497066 /NCGR_PEP_ID=MMETSP0208-20121228/23618_1 /TAXON_ID=197538 /ORGANISM="Strombidium inclinatum, Strain S3" /LENGTH=211 /DNA_ID=CAMNT_0010773763 /DNA_START=74 /DNA_END=706 /DNA_ORIENTATION=-